MAQTIKLKRSATQGATPATTALELGEVAINTYDGKMFIKKDDGTESIVEIGAGGGVSDIVEDTTPQLGGDLDTNGNDISFGDNDKANFGDGNDLQIYHDGSNSYISDQGTGSLRITAQDFRVRNSANNASVITGLDGAGVFLYHNGSQKLATTSTGIDVTGSIVIDTNPSGHSVEEAIRIDDGGGTSDRALQFFEYHDSGSRYHSISFNTHTTSDGTDYTYTQGSYGGSSSIQFANNGNIAIFADAQVTSGSTDDITPKKRAQFQSNGDVSFYEDTGTTAKLTWDSSAETLNFADNGKAIFGAGSDLQIYHNGSASIVGDFGTGDLLIRGENLKLQNTAGENYLVATNNDATRLYFDNLEKLATTSTGIDVTGTVTADGLTVSSGTPSPEIEVHDTDATYGFVLSQFNSGDGILKTNNLERVRITNAGNVGIGTTGPSGKIHAHAADSQVAVMAGGDVSDPLYPAFGFDGQIGSNGGRGAGMYLPADSTLAWSTAGSERMRIDSSGIVTIGGNTAWHAGNDGSGSGLDADTVDGVHASGFLQATGATMTGNLALGDNVKIQIGDEPNLEIYHNGSHSFIQDIGGGSLYIQANPQVKLMINGENGVWCQANSYTRLYHNNALKLETSTTGISVTGDVTTSAGDGYYGSFLQQGDSGIYIDAATDAVIPYGSDATRDNALDLGRYNVRWDDVFATNGTIQTSDIREKQDIEALNDAEERVAVAAKGLLRKYRWKNRVAEKGDEARIHFGIMAQDLVAAFEAEGLDPSRYAMFTKSEWWEGDKVHPAIPEQLDEDGSILVEGKDEWVESNYAYDNQDDAPADAVYHYRMGVRYSELLAFIIAAI